MWQQATFTVVVLCGLQGCAAQQYWARAGTDLRQTASDLHACRISANAGSQRVYSGLELEAPCMTAKGYGLTPTPPKEIPVTTGTNPSGTLNPAALTEIDDALRKIERVYQLEYQRTEDEYRYRVIDAPPSVTFSALRRSFLELGLAIKIDDINIGSIAGEAAAPTPLTPEEWLRIAKHESPRLANLSKGMLAFSDNPDHYTIIFKATLRPMNGKTLVLFDYYLDSPKMRRMGLTPLKYAPALAIHLACEKLWANLTKQLRDAKVQPPRRRSKQEIDA